MSVRWNIAFCSVGDRAYSIRIHDADYTGEPVSLEPAAEPFTLDEGGGELFVPVSTESGYVRVVDNGDLDGLLPGSALDRKVELYDSDEECLWTGYLAPQTFDTLWESPPRVCELPVVSALAALDAVTVTESQGAPEPVASYIWYALSLAGLILRDLYVPVQMLSVAGAEVSCAELRLRLSRYNFLAVNDSDNTDDPDYEALVGRSWLSVLTDICAYFGWTMIQCGRDVVLNSSRMDTERFWRVSLAQLTAMAMFPEATYTIPTVSRATVAAGSLTLDGDSHKMSVVPGFRKVTVETEINAGDSLPELPVKGKELWRNDYGVVAYVEYRTVLRVIDNRSTDITLRQYAKVGGVVTEIPWHAPSDSDGLYSTQACLVETDSWDIGTEGKFNYSFTPYLRLSRTVDATTRLDVSRPLAVLRGRSAGVFPAGGCLCLKADTWNTFICKEYQVNVKDAHGVLAWGPFDNDLRVSLRVGNLYYDGEGWTETPCVIGLPCGADDSYDWEDAPRMPGKVRNTKTLSMPYNGAEGYVFPISETMVGFVELTIYPWVTNYPSATSAPDDFEALLLANLSLEYFSDTQNVLDKGVRVTRVLAAFGEEKSVKLNLTSNQTSRVGLASLFRVGGLIAAPSDYAGDVSCMPEEWLLDGMCRAYARSYRRLELDVELTDAFDRYSLISVDGDAYVITGVKRDYSTDHMTLILVHY